jgi:hypothetical protein
VLAVLVSDALASGAPPRFAGCASYLSPTAAGSVRPASIVIACGDGNFYVDHLRWSSWGPTVANATGLGHANDCTPYCAAGKFHTYRLSVRLDLRRVCGTTRRIAQFTRISWRFTGVRPRGVGPTDSQSFRCSKP